jgi:hypothetical protein
MTHARRSFSALLIGISGLACFASSAAAGAADYTTTAGFTIPNNTGINGIPSSVFVPPGRTAVQKVELTELQPTFTAGGGTDLELRLQSPTATELTLFGTGCATFPNTTNFSMNDEASELAGSAGFCATEVVGGAGRPNNVDTETFSIFNGATSSGVWTLIVRDVGLQAPTGIWKGWNLRITHAPPVLTAKAARQRLARTLTLRAGCNAECSLRIGGAARPRTERLAPNSPTLLAVSLKKKVARKIRRRGRGRARVRLTATDPTGGTATRIVRIRLRA